MTSFCRRDGRPRAARGAVALALALSLASPPALAAPQPTSTVTVRPSPAEPPTAAAPAPTTTRQPAPVRALTRALVLPRREGDPLPPATDTTLRDGIREGLRRGGAAIVEAGPVGLTGECADASCHARLRSLGVRYLVRPTLAVVDRDYALRLELIDLGNNTSAGVFEERCSLCGLHEALAHITDGAAELLAPRTREAPTAPPPATLIVVSDPAGAEVELDGAAAGQTPLERSTTAGPHRLAVRLAGHAAVERDVELADGERGSFYLSLRPDLRPTRPRLGAGLLGVGVPLAAAGVALAALDESTLPLGCRGDACRNQLDTTWPAAVTLLTGAALTAIGAVLVRQARQRARRPR